MSSPWTASILSVSFFPFIRYSSLQVGSSLQMEMRSFLSSRKAVLLPYNFSSVTSWINEIKSNYHVFMILCQNLTTVPSLEVNISQGSQRQSRYGLSCGKSRLFKGLQHYHDNTIHFNRLFLWFYRILFPLVLCIEIILINYQAAI